MHFGLGGTITTIVTGSVREMKVARNSIFMSISIAKVITDSWEIFL